MTDGRRRDLALRTHPLVFGVMLFLASELMFFGGMLAAYYSLRGGDAAWPPAGARFDMLESGLGTLGLGLSDGAMVLCLRALAGARYTRARGWLAVTLVLGVVFLATAVDGWVKNPFRIDSNAYASCFYMLTGFHALHVLAGLFLLAGLFAGIRMPAFTRDRRAGAEAIGLYWHFVFGVWVLLWGTLYVIR